ncbi:hypothetical protein SRHO_G00188750 [Serrasalmus rhombeus]
MILCAVISYESNLTFTQDTVLHKEVCKSGVDDATEHLPQITVDTDASVVIRIQFISTFVDGRYKTSGPDVTEITCTQNHVEKLRRASWNFLLVFLIISFNTPSDRLDFLGFRFDILSLSSCSVMGSPGVSGTLLLPILMCLVFQLCCFVQV